MLRMLLHINMEHMSWQDSSVWDWRDSSDVKGTGIHTHTENKCNKKCKNI